MVLVAFDDGACAKPHRHRLPLPKSLDLNERWKLWKRGIIQCVHSEIGNDASPLRAGAIGPGGDGAHARDASAGTAPASFRSSAKWQATHWSSLIARSSGISVEQRPSRPLAWA
jgi:hypothetical protein